MACDDLDFSSTSNIIPTFNFPSKLSSLAANSIIRLLVYEDYEDCNFYRWDPVTIWQFETHQPKKKKSSKKSATENSFYGHPPPPWKGVKKLRNWWCDNSSSLLGHPVESPLRQLVVDGLEKQSWTSCSEEEDILFLLLRLCMDTHLHFTKKCINENWYADLAQIIENLGPFLLQKLVVENDVFQGNTIIPSTIIQNSPNLLILRIGQWELSNDILFSMASHCPLLQEFSIHGMEPDVFMSDDAFFKCFFNGLTPDEVQDCHENNTSVQVSFVHLKYVDMLFCKQTERLILMLTYFYPNVSLSAFDISTDSNNLINSFVNMNIKMPFLRLCCRAEDILDERWSSLFRNSFFLKELRIHIDDKFSGADTESIFNRQLEKTSRRLMNLVTSEKSTIDSLSIKSHQNIDMTKVLLPTFGSYGANLKCLYFVYDYHSLAVNTLYQLLNLCPFLEKLILDISVSAKDISSKFFSTPLREHPTLETLVLQEPECDTGEPESEEEMILAFNVIAQDLLKVSPNLKNFSMPLTEDLDTKFLQSLRSRSVERLQLNIIGDSISNQWISVLSSFPCLKLFSLQADPRTVWSECLDTLTHKGINVTKKSQEFTNVFRWYRNSDCIKFLGHWTSAVREEIARQYRQEIFLYD